jgi:ADP-heptose:LPS heptosyltransferase
VDKNKTSHLLVIRLSALGDVAMTIPVLLALTRQFPDIKITVLTREFFGPLFEDIPNVSLHTADVKGKHKGILGLWRLYKELKELKFDAIADLHHVLRSQILKLFFISTGIRFIQIDKGRKEKKDLTAWKQKEISPLRSTHERYADVFRALGFSITLEASDIKKKTMPTTIVGNYLEDSKFKYIGIAPFAAFKSKMYPLPLMEKVVEHLNNTNQYKIFLFGGGPSERQQMQKLASIYTNCINVVGVFSFREELMALSHLDLMLAMDSGNAHLAAMYGVPTITLWGVTHPFAGFTPFAQEFANTILADREQYPFIPTSVYGNKFPVNYEQAIASIDPQEVVNKIQSILD